MPRKDFLTKYTKGRAAKGHYLLFDDRLFDLKAIWASAHRPPVKPSSFHTADARKGLEVLHFTCINEEEKILFDEGRRIFREAALLARNQSLMKQVKLTYGLCCVACGFSFEVVYGSLG